MIFRAYQTDIDGITNRIGFSKRSFAEWGKQVSTNGWVSMPVITKQRKHTAQRQSDNSLPFLIINY